MSVDTKKKAPAPATPDLVSLSIDGMEVSVPKGTLIIRAAEQMGIDIPRFCDHPLLDPAGCCRACVVEIPDAGNGRAMKPTPACTQPVMPGMVVQTADSNEQVKKHQAGLLELLLINHPLDCPICDKGGECPLQNQAMSHGPAKSRYEGAKRTYPKPIQLSAQILLDRDRCVLCQRCTRFSAQISGDPYINLLERGARSQIGIYEDKPYNSYFSGNVVQICPVGALTSSDYRFQARPFDLVSTKVTCENCAAGCELRVDHRHGSVRRRLAGNNPQVNEEWNCDRGRFGFRYATGPDRLTHPLIRKDGVLQPSSWTEAIDVAVRGLQNAKNTSVLTGGRLSYEASYAYSKFARTVLKTNNIDFRARPIGAGEAEFLAAEVAQNSFDNSVHYQDVETANNILLVGLEPEDECPILFLRLRKAWRKKHVKIVTVAPFLTNGSSKMGAKLISCFPGEESSVLANIDQNLNLDENSIIFVGERAGLSPDCLTQVAKLAERTGAKLAWVPRKAGDIGAIHAGCLPNLLPGGRLVSDPLAVVDMKTAWAAEDLPTVPGLDIEAQLSAARDGKLDAMIVAGVDLGDLADPAAAKTSFENCPFVISVEQRESEISQLADVVFPVALIEEQAGSFLNWENRVGTFELVNRNNRAPITDIRLLSVLAEAMGCALGVANIAEARSGIAELEGWDGAKAELNPLTYTQPVEPAGNVTLASWRVLLDDAKCLDNQETVKQTAPKPVIKVSPATCKLLGLQAGQMAKIDDQGEVFTREVEVVENMCEGVIWTATKSGMPRQVEIFAVEAEQVGGMA